jgi:eukaryotic-like serine/threonine-protein kinase
VSPALGPAVDAWFERACAREPVNRFATAKDLADAFAQCVAGPTSLGLAKTVRSVPPAALSSLGTTTNAPTSHGRQSASGAPTSSRVAAFVAVMVAGAFITLGGLLVYRLRTSVAPAAPSRTTATETSAPAPLPSPDLESVSIESLPKASASTAPPTQHAHPASSSTKGVMTRPATSFDRNSIE